MSRPPRILFVSHESSLYGAPLSLLYIIDWFRSRARIAAVTIGTGGFETELADRGIEVEVLDFPSDYRRRFPGRLLDLARRQWHKLLNAVRLARRARAFQADLVYVNSVSRLSNIVGAWLSGRPVVVHVREVENYLDSPSFARRMLLRSILRLPTRFVTDSEASRRALLKVNPKADAHVVHNGVEPDKIAHSAQARERARKRLGLGVDEIVVGFIGKRSIRKGFDVFRDAARAVHGEEAGIRFVVIGDHHETIEDSELKIPGSVDLTFQNDIWDTYVALDIFVMASRQEPFARVNLEASAAGCAVIATTVDGNLELFSHEENALLIPPGDPEALAGSIKRLAHDSGLRHALGSAAQTMVWNNYTLEICHEKILGKIADLLPATPRHVNG